MGKIRLKDATDLFSYLSRLNENDLSNGNTIRDLTKELKPYGFDYAIDNKYSPNIDNPKRLRSDLRGMCNIAKRYIRKGAMPKRIKQIYRKIR
jgi:hypothetical protein